MERALALSDGAQGHVHERQLGHLSSSDLRTLVQLLHKDIDKPEEKPCFAAG
jgi:hypothetical protein